MASRDTLGRPRESLRISVTDRCNLRCRYCMPEERYAWIPRDEILTFEEIGTLTDAFQRFGVDRVRLTGGEPLIRHDLSVLARILASRDGIREVTLTTNGLLLAEHAEGLRDAGISRITVSLDTLREDRFQFLAGQGSLQAVLDGIDACQATGLTGLKINTVILRGTNDDELVDLLEYGKRVGAEIRFIEYMDVGGATEWSSQKVVSRSEILSRLRAHYGDVAEIRKVDAAPAEQFVLSDSTQFGIIASTTAPFCKSCNRSRLTCDGIWYMCLYATEGVDLKQPLRGGASSDELLSLITESWRNRADRGADERVGVRGRGPLLHSTELRHNTHMEMHTRGG